ncbi:MAG: hypothetical protein JST00_30195 [Deltaproteobacteria bacterium]|nr:hypothetical protein [Deltaproteobacteria bacterium]
MALSKIKALGWVLSEEIQAADLDAIDANIENALDRRPGQSDELGSIVSLAGGRIIRQAQNGTDADGIYAIGGGQIIVAPTLTADRDYVLSTVGARENDLIEVWVNEYTLGTNGFVIRVVNGGGVGDTLAHLGKNGHGFRATFIYREPTGWCRYDGFLRGLVVQTFTTPAQWLCPAGVTFGFFIGCGGGGGGGGGRANSTTIDRWISGGGGGGGALEHMLVRSVAPLSLYDILPGGGGAGGVGGAGPKTGEPGEDGSDSTVELVGTRILAMHGAAGGRSQISTYATSSDAMVRAHPGGPTRGQLASGWSTFADDMVVNAILADVPSFGIPLQPATGGHGNGTGTAVRGRVNEQGGHAGGAGGAKGGDSGQYRGGGGGGGGGAGPYGPGGDGGNGGRGGGAPGSDGGDGIGGGGGGGGGSGGSQITASGPGGKGGTGGGGRIAVAYAR